MQCTKGQRHRVKPPLWRWKNDQFVQQF